jgi:hypothetical protein
MSRVIPLGSIPRTNILPTDVYRLKVTSLEETMSKENEAEGRKAKLMFKLVTQIVEPKSHKGMPFTTNFCIGNEDDPEAELLETWQTTFGGRNFAKFTDKVGVPFGDEEDSATLCKQVEGAEFLATIIEKQNDGKKNPNRKGQPENDITAFWSVGEKEPGSGAEAGGSKTTARVGRTPAAGAQPKAAPSEDVTCSACPPGSEKVPRKALKAHTDEHLKKMQEDLKRQAEGGEEDE